MKPTLRRLAVLLFACSNLNAQSVSPAARRAVQTIQKLRAIDAPDSRHLDAGPPDKVPYLLRQLNQQLKALITEYLNDQTQRSWHDETDILDRLRAAGWQELPSNKWTAYGEIRKIQFSEPRNESDLLIVSTQLWLPCGSTDPDSAIYVFHGASRKWDLVLSTDSDFDPNQGADEGGLQYQISPSDSKGRWFLVVAQMPPACGGPRNVLQYKVLRPAQDADTPALLLAGREEIETTFAPPFRLDVQEDWFAITEGRSRVLGSETGIRILRYAVDNNKIRRIAPLSLYPEDFANEWARLPWDDARQWVSVSEEGSLKQWHAKLNNLGKNSSTSSEIELVRQCSGDGETDGTWMIELAVDSRSDPSMEDKRLYLEVVKKQNTFFMNNIRESRPTGCSGKVFPARRDEQNLPSW